MSDDSAVVDAHLVRLDTDACQRFVSDLWAARGFDTVRDGSSVVATRSGHSLVILPVSGRRRTVSLEADVDVVVCFGDRNLDTITARTDARVLGPSDLREMLRYAVAPSDRMAILRRHLGAEPSELPVPLALRAARATERIHQQSLPLVVAVLTVLTVVAAAMVGGSVTLSASPPVGSDFGVTDTAGAGTSETGAEPTATTQPPPTDRAPAAVPPGTLANVPGVSYEGVTNLTALAVAHDRALGNQSYSLWTDRYRPENGVPGAPRTQRDTDITVANGTYLVEASFEQSGERRLVRVVYFDGADWYVDDRSTNEPTIRWIDGASGVSVSPDPRVLRRTLVTRYLDTPTTRVTERLDFGGTPRYRLEGSGRPSSFSTFQVYNYSFVAILDDDGLVHEATVEFTVVTAEGSYRLRFEWTYGQFGATTVRNPAWVTQATSPGTDSPTPTNRTAQPS